MASFDYDPISDPDAPTGLEGWTTARLQAGDPNRSTGLYQFAGQSDMERKIAKELANRRNTAATTAASGSVTAPASAAGALNGGGSPGYGDISGLFREAIASLSGEGEKAYQTGKRRSMADIAMQSVQSGMANTLNMPAATAAYDEANRPAFNMMLGQQKAGILTGLGQTAAGMYGQNLGAQTQRYGVDVGAQTSAAQQALQKYISELSNTTANREMNLRASGIGGYAR